MKKHILPYKFYNRNISTVTWHTHLVAWCLASCWPRHSWDQAHNRCQKCIVNEYRPTSAASFPGGRSPHSWKGLKRRLEGLTYSFNKYSLSNYYYAFGLGLDAPAGLKQQKLYWLVVPRVDSTIASQISVLNNSHQKKKSHGHCYVFL